MSYKINIEKDLILNIRSLQIVSSWVDRDKTLLHKIYRKTWPCIHYIILCLHFTYLTQVEDFKDLIAPLAIFISSCNGGFKYRAFNLPRVVNMLKNFDQPLCTAKNQAEKDILQQALKLARFLSIGWIVAGYGTYFAMEIIAYINHTFLGPIYFPKSMDSYYNIMFLINSIGMFFGGISNVSIDLFVFVVQTLMSSQFDILCNRLEELDGETEQAHSKLLDCIHHFRIIKTWTQEFTSCFHYIILSQFLGSFLLFCLMLYTLSFTPFGSDFIMLICFMVCTFGELCITCWFGNEIHHKSDKISVAAYKCKWYNGNTNFQKDLLFFICCSEKPITLAYGKLFVTTMPYFLQVMKASWSFYVMLVTVKE